MELGPEWCRSPFTLSNEPIPNFLRAKLIILWLFEVKISKNIIFLSKHDLEFQERVKSDIVCMRLWPNKKSPKRCRRYHKGTVCANSELQKPFGHSLEQHLEKWQNGLF